MELVNISFIKLVMIKNDLIFEYKIVDEDNSAITKIKHFIGNYYYLSALQLLYASNHKL